MRMVNFSHDSVYDKRDDFDFPIVNFPYLSSNIPESPAYGVFVSQLIRYARVCSKYEDILFRGYILVSKLLKQGYSARKLQTTFRKFMVVIQTLFTNLTPLCHICWMICSLTVTYDWFPVVLSKSWRVAQVGQEMLTLSGTPDFTKGSSWFYSFDIHIHCVLLNLSV